MKKDHIIPLPETGPNLVGHSAVTILMKMQVEVVGNSHIISKDQFSLEDISFKLPMIAQTEIQSAGKF